MQSDLLKKTKKKYKKKRNRAKQKRGKTNKVAHVQQMAR